MTIENISNTEWGPLTLQTTIKTAVGISRGKIMVESGIGFLLRYLHTVHTSHFSSNVKIMSRISSMKDIHMMILPSTPCNEGLLSGHFTSKEHKFC